MQRNKSTADGVKLVVVSTQSYHRITQLCNNFKAAMSIPLEKLILLVPSMLEWLTKGTG